MKLIALFSVISIVLADTKDDLDMINEFKNSKDFTGKVALVTGSNSGIGLEITKLLSGLGAQVVVTGRKVEDITAAAKQVLAVSPKQLKPLEFVADLTNSTQTAELFEETLKTFGRLDLLVNNAGIYLTAGIDSDKFMADFEEMLDVDVRPALQLIRLSITALSKTKGTIINISAYLTAIPQEKLLAYSIAKQALEMSTKVLAQELGPKGIRINTIRPGSIASHPNTQPNANTIKHTPLGRIGQTQDIANAVAFLASEAADFITGAVIDIDGGLSLGAAGKLASGG